MNRCKKCLLPEGKFNVVLNARGICNYCDYFEQHKTAILNKIETLSKMNWSTIRNSAYKNGPGYEQLPSMNNDAPIVMPKDAIIISFYCSSSGRMIGYRDAKIFYVFWFDWSPFFPPVPFG